VDEQEASPGTRTGWTALHRPSSLPPAWERLILDSGAPFPRVPRLQRTLAAYTNALPRRMWKVRAECTRRAMGTATTMRHLVSCRFLANALCLLLHPNATPPSSPLVLCVILAWSRTLPLHYSHINGSQGVGCCRSMGHGISLLVTIRDLSSLLARVIYLVATCDQRAAPSASALSCIFGRFHMSSRVSSPRWQVQNHHSRALSCRCHHSSRSYSN